MKYLFVLMSVIVISCTKGEKALQSGVWNLNSYTYSGTTIHPAEVTIKFGSNGIYTITTPLGSDNYEYMADDKMITALGNTGSYKASKKRAELNIVIYPRRADPNDPNPPGTSTLSK